MSNSVTLRSPHLVANELDISPATLRRWSDEFTDFLSIGAGASKSRSHRRYTEQDVATLALIKELMNSGLTYEQVRLQLNGRTSNGDGSEPEIIHEPVEDNDGSDNFERISTLVGEAFDADDDRALITSNSDEPAAVTFLTNTLATLSDSQKSILNSQAANRELLGVLLQDNFNLKEENNRLRERMLDVERDVAQNRQDEEWRREALRQELETKIAAASQLSTEAIATARSMDTPQIKTVESKPGCLGMLFGRGSTQIITAPQRRKIKKRTEGQQPATPPGASAQPAETSPPQQTNPSHPKPLFPPE
jgi:DNA-binding transcriptional MerR regulator